MKRFENPLSLAATLEVWRCRPQPIAGRTRVAATSLVVPWFLLILFVFPRASSLAQLVTLDGSFNPAPGSSDICFAQEANGKIIIGGDFATVMGQARYQRISRLSASGSIDASFNPVTTNWLHALVVQADGKIVLGGGLSSIAGTARSRIARLNSDGRLDLGFNPGANNIVRALAEQADGRILVAGEFTMLGGQTRGRIGRVETNGILDDQFNPTANNTINTLAVQADGKILIGGAFTQVNGQPRSRIARLNYDGTLDEAFIPGASNTVNCLAIQADGMILLAGMFTAVNGMTRERIARLIDDGTLDETFNPSADGSVESVLMQTDGKILIGGLFTTVNGVGRSRVARLDASGTLDNDFNPAPNNAVNGLALQADGRILIGGSFTTLAGQPRNGLGRLINSTAANQTLSLDGSTITWLRSGSGPEISRCAFGFSTNGVDWASLGDGVRVVGGWQLTNVSVPSTGTLRARGYAQGGRFNASSWYVYSFLGSPVILDQPMDQVAPPGSNVTFSVVADGNLPLHYRWQRDGTNIVNATNVTLTVTNVQRSHDNAWYSVVVSNQSGIATSIVARLVLKVPLNVSTLAGLAGSSGTNNGLRANARFQSPWDVVVDKAGNIYVADRMNHAIRKVASDGRVSTFAGWPGTNGNTGGIGTEARFNQPTGLTLDADGNLYVADAFNHIIRKVTASAVVTALASNFFFPTGVAVDAATNVLVASWGDATIRKIAPSGLVSHLAGVSNNHAYAEGFGTNALFNRPEHLVLNDRGRAYIADANNFVIREMTLDGLVSAFAGLPGYGDRGTNDGIGGGAHFGAALGGVPGPKGLAIDRDGNLYVADTAVQTIRKVTPGGAVFTIAGLASALGASSNGIGSNARFSSPSGIAVDDWGNVYIADTANHTIRKGVPAFSNLPPVAVASATPVSGPAPLLVSFRGNDSYDPEGAALTYRWNFGDGSSPSSTVSNRNYSVPGVYNATIEVSDGIVTNVSTNIIITVTAAAFISTPPQSRTVAAGYDVTLNTTASGSAPLAYQWFKDGAAQPDKTNAMLALMSVDGTTAGNYTVVVSNALAVVTSSPPASLAVEAPLAIFTLAGQAGFAGSSGGYGSDARFDGMGGVAVDAEGNVYVADQTNHIVRKITPAGFVSTLAGQTAISGDADGMGNEARFNQPNGVAVDAAGQVYVADSGNRSVRTITPEGIVRTLAVLSASPKVIAVDGAGNVYVAGESQTIQKITPAGVVRTLAGILRQAGFTDGSGFYARFDHPNGLAVDAAANVYVADGSNHVIRKITADGIVTTLAGSVRNAGSVDGVRNGARFNHPVSLAVDDIGNVYVTELNNHAIRKLTPDGVVNTLAGLWDVAGTNDRTGISARLNAPGGIALDQQGNLYFSDSSFTMRKGVVSHGQPIITAQPRDATIISGTNGSFSVTAIGAPDLAYQWRFNGNDLSDDAHIIGSRSNLLIVVGAEDTDVGEFQVTVSNAVGVVTSVPAMLRVLPFTPPPKIELPGVGPNGDFQFTLPALINHTMVIEFSTNLEHWQPLQTNAPGGGGTVFTDSSANDFPIRFYRLRLLP